MPCPVMGPRRHHGRRRPGDGSSCGAPDERSAWHETPRHSRGRNLVAGAGSGSTAWHGTGGGRKMLRGRPGFPAAAIVPEILRPGAVSYPTDTATPMSKSSPQVSGGTFADRIRLLIQRVGSATEIARMCGFSEGVVRSWRDGNTDPSRARCVTLARTLGISLVWLVAGEGAILADVDQSGFDEQTTSDTTQRPRTRMDGATGHVLEIQGAGMDTQRLNAAMRILQSELELTGQRLSLADHSDLLAKLYEAVGPGGMRVDTDAMLSFNRQLAERIGRASA